MISKHLSYPSLHYLKVGSSACGSLASLILLIKFVCSLCLFYNWLFTTIYYFVICRLIEPMGNESQQHFQVDQTVDQSGLLSNDVDVGDDPLI